MRKFVFGHVLQLENGLANTIASYHYCHYKNKSNASDFISIQKIIKYGNGYLIKQLSVSKIFAELSEILFLKHCEQSPKFTCKFIDVQV